MIWSTNSSPSLAAENFQLKKRIAELEARASSPISLDPAKGKITIEDLTVGSLAIEKLELRSQALAETAEKLSSSPHTLPHNLLNPAVLKELGRESFTVENLRASIPLRLVNSLLDQIAGAELKKAGLSDIQLTQNRDGSLKIQGTSHKGLSLPFEVNGNLSATKDGQVKFQLLTSRLGALPLPGFLVSLATSFAGDKLKGVGVSGNGTDFLIDPTRHKPENVHFQLGNLELANGRFFIAGGLPSAKGTSPVPRIARRPLHT